MTPRATFASILDRSNRVREIAAGIFTTLPADGTAAPYDRRAAVYDAVVGRSLYHRVFWGTSVSAYTTFARAALQAAGDGCFVEAGCGSLLFTYPIHRDPLSAFVLLADRSIQMLHRGVRRLSSRDGGVPDGIAVLHADIASLPVRPAAFSSILCLNVLHVPCDAGAISAEFARVLAPKRGKLFVSSLVRSGRWSDAYMMALHRMGELAPLLTRDELCEKVAGQWGVVESATVKGNLCFVVIRHAG